MKITTSTNSATEKREKLRVTNQFADTPPLSDPVCGTHCTNYKAASCHRDCADAPAMLSSDPDKFPVERKIAPLVFELKRLGYFTPCWSCEGHLSPQGKSWKLPRVWFYVTSVTYVQLLGDAIGDMVTKRLLKSKWQIKYVHTDNDSIDPLFSLEPDDAGAEIPLRDLQADIGTIAANLQVTIKATARSAAHACLAAEAPA